MKFTVFDELEQVDPEALRVDAASLYRAFEHVTDGRKAKGKRYVYCKLNVSHQH